MSPDIQTGTDLNKSIETAINAAQQVLHLGGSTTMADRTFRNIIGKVQITDIDIMWRLDNIVISYNDNGITKTFLKSVGPVGTSLTAVSNVIELSEKVRDGKIPISEVDAGLKSLSQAPPIHSHFVFILVAGLAAAFYSLFHHGKIESVLVVFLAAVIGQTIRIQLQKKDFRDSHTTFICGLISAGITSVFLHLGIGEADVPTLIACLIYLVPGLLMINGFVDFTKQRYIFIGLQRMLNAFFLFVILAFVILIAYTFIKI
ncbi:MAG: threonine/serine exporter family protein [Ignavibacteria bacterium]|nr:threonine/serine exporter family protein [Ignavibacteria bacterium]